MKTIQFTFILVIGLTLANCSDNKKTNNTKTDNQSSAKAQTANTKTETLLNYKLLNDEVYDAPIKTQVQLDILILDTAISEQKIRKLLTFLYGKTIKRTGFKHHSNPTNIYIYAFTSKEKAESGMGQWIGMISKSYNDNHPKIAISDIQLNSLTLKPTEKFGFSESVRIEIWNKSIKVEDRAQKEADIKYPLDKVGITMKDIEKNGALNEKLKEKYEKELATEYGIDLAIIDSISMEGLMKGWPFPKN